MLPRGIWIVAATWRLAIISRTCRAIATLVPACGSLACGSCVWFARLWVLRVVRSLVGLACGSLAWFTCHRTKTTFFSACATVGARRSWLVGLWARGSWLVGSCLAPHASVARASCLVPQWPSGSWAKIALGLIEMTSFERDRRVRFQQAQGEDWEGHPRVGDPTSDAVDSAPPELAPRVGFCHSIEPFGTTLLVTLWHNTLLDPLAQCGANQGRVCLFDAHCDFLGGVAIM
jgi:hypothetical protein